MKRATALLLLFFAFMNCCGQQQWEGVITKRNGVVFVDNHGTPLYPLNKIELRPLLTIQSQESMFDNDPLDKVRDVAVDEKGNIFVSDGGNARIVVFDSSANYLRTFGKKGEGPGEFLVLSVLDFDANGVLYAFDNKLRRISMFTRDGGFLDSFAFKEMASGFAVKDPNTVFVSPISFLSKDSLVAVYNTSGTKIGSFGAKLADTDLISISGEFAKVFYGEGTIFYTFPYPYRIEEYSDAGLLKRVITLRKNEFQPPEPPPVLADKGRMLGSSLPASIDGMVVLKNGLLVVQVSYDLKAPELDFFSPSGKFLQTISLPEEHRLGCVYGNSIYTYVSGGGSNFASVTHWLVRLM